MRRLYPFTFEFLEEHAKELGDGQFAGL